MKKLKEVLKKVLKVVIGVVKKVVFLVRDFFVWIFVKVKMQKERFFEYWEKIFEKNVFSDKVQPMKKGDLFLCFLILGILFCGTLFFYNQVKKELIVIQIIMITTMVLLALIFCCFIVNFIYTNGEKTKMFKRIYILVFVLTLIDFAICFIPVIPVFWTIEKIQYKKADSKRVHTIKRIVKIGLSWLLFIALSLVQIERAYELNAQNNTRAIALCIAIIYIVMPFFTCEIYRIYETKREAYKEQSIMLIIIIILIKFILFIIGKEISIEGVKEMMDIASWTFALIGIITLKIEKEK